MRVDEWGRVLFTTDGIVDLLLKGTDISNLTAEPGPDLDAYNHWCEHNDKGKFAIEGAGTPTRTPDEEHEARALTWVIPDEIREINVREYLLSLCFNDLTRDRVNMEMDLFEERQLIPLLQLMIYLVYHFTQNNVVWGVGRGSSVSSYVLFLIGIHKIDSIKYGLDVRDFLK